MVAAKPYMYLLVKVIFSASEELSILIPWSRLATSRHCSAHMVSSRIILLLLFTSLSVSQLHILSEYSISVCIPNAISSTLTRERCSVVRTWAICTAPLPLKKGKRVQWCQLRLNLLQVIGFFLWMRGVLPDHHGYHFQFLPPEIHREKWVPGK